MRKSSLIFLASLIATSACFAKDVIVNGERLPSSTVLALEQAYQTQIVDGHYWYDRVAGLWGLQGGPAIGQIMANLNLGGRLDPSASGGQTPVFVNGRALHPMELQQLVQSFGYVTPGRYWLNANGVGGFEGGPPQFDLKSVRGGSSGYNRQTLGGGLMSDGSCAGYLHPDGPSVMTGNC